MASVEIGRAEWLDAAEVARLVRAALRRAFPADRFSVRLRRGAGGSSIRASWTDGPPAGSVEAVIGPYAGGRFDAMVDLAYRVEHWLEPDGRATLAYSPGTEGSRGSHPGALADPPSPDARLVRFGADHVFAVRDLSAAFREAIEAELLEQWGSEANWIEQHRDAYGGWAGAIWRRSCELEYRAGIMLPAGPELERIYRRSGCEPERCEVAVIAVLTKASIAGTRATHSGDRARCVLNRGHGGLCVFGPAGELGPR